MLTYYKNWPVSYVMLGFTLEMLFCGPIDSSMNAIEVLLAIRGYIKHFFGCKECSRNFLRGAAHLDDMVLSDRDTVMFLWRSHNKANYFLRNDLTEDPQHQKVQFPDLSQCPSCHVTAPNGSVIFDDDAVFQFLQRMYSGTNIIRDSESVGMRPVNDRRRGVNFAFVPTVIDVSSLDVSLCLVFYILCTGLLGLLYLWFCRQRRGRKNGSSFSLV